jgi:hypothetical protein
MPASTRWRAASSELQPPSSSGACCGVPAGSGSTGGGPDPSLRSVDPLGLCHRIDQQVDQLRRPVGGALAPVADLSLGIWGSIGSGVCGFTHRLSGAWQERNGDHVSGKRCSGLDLLGCDPGPGYAARGFNTRETELAYRSLRLRDNARAASSRSLWCVASLAHLRCAHRLG